MSKAIYTKNAPDAIGPYSQAVVAGKLVFTSGQIAIDPATGNVEATTIEAQTEQVCKNICAVLDLDYEDLKDKLPKPEANDPYATQTALDALQVDGDVIE